MAPALPLIEKLIDAFLGEKDLPPVSIALHYSRKKKGVSAI